MTQLIISLFVIFQVAGPGNNPTVLEGHMQEVTAVTWYGTLEEVATSLQLTTLAT